MVAALLLCRPEPRTRVKSLSTSWRPVAMAVVMLAFLCSYGYAQANWPQFGNDPANSASNPAETILSTATVSRLKPKWTFTTGGDVSARAAVVNGVVYFPDWGGNLWALEGATGKLVWGKQIASYGLINPLNGKDYTSVVSRTTPAVREGVLYIGTRGGWLLAVNAANGNLVWKAQLGAGDAYANITASPSFYSSMIFAGVTSTQEANPGGAPGTAVGSVVALDAGSGKILWRANTTVPGYTGAGVWGSSPVIDAGRGLVFATTGDNYSAPTDPAYLKCIAAGGTAGTCQSAENHVDSVIAMSISTGAIVWAQRMTVWPQNPTHSGSDFFNLGCAVGMGCPVPPGPDYDFASGPNEFAYPTAQGHRTLLGAGQKSGTYGVFDPDNGDLVWQLHVGPGSPSGGIMWGSATDGKRIYIAISNFNHVPTHAGNAGYWEALDGLSGQFLWRTPDPNGAADIGPVTVANGVVYATSAAGGTSSPTMFAMDASSGRILWSFVSGSTSIAGATVVNGTVYWGTGYGRLGAPYTGGHTFYAFTLDGK